MKGGQAEPWTVSPSHQGGEVGRIVRLRGRENWSSVGGAGGGHGLARSTVHKLEGGLPNAGVEGAKGVQPRGRRGRKPRPPGHWARDGTA